MAWIERPRSEHSSVTRAAHSCSAPTAATARLCLCPSWEWWLPMSRHRGMAATHHRPHRLRPLRRLLLLNGFLVDLVSGSGGGIGASDGVAHAVVRIEASRRQRPKGWT